MYILLNNKNLINLNLQLEFLMQSTGCYVFPQPLNVNSYNGLFSNYIGVSIRNTNAYWKNMICLNAAHSLTGRKPVFFVTFSTNIILPFYYFLCFLYFYLQNTFGIIFLTKTCLSVIFVCDIAHRRKQLQVLHWLWCSLSFVSILYLCLLWE